MACWRTARDEPSSWSTPHVVEVDGRRQVVVNATGKVRSYDLATGKVVWEVGGMTANAIPTPVSAGGLLFVTSGFRGNALKAIRLAGATGDLTGTPAVVWSYDQDTPYVPSPLLYDGLLYVYQQGLNTEFLEYLGFTINPKLTPLAKNPGEQVSVSEERLDVIDADVIVFATEKPEDIATFKKVPTFHFLDAVKGKRAVYTDATLSGAMYFMTPLALTYVLERLTPQLAKAVAGEAPEEMVG